MRRSYLPVLLGSTLLLGQYPATGMRHLPRPQGLITGLEPWPATASFVESPGLKLDVRAPYIRNMPQADGYRLLSLVVKPGEKLSFKLKAEDDKVSLHAYVPKPPPASMAWHMALRNANLHGPIVQEQLTIQNTTQEPQTLVLMIVGHHGYGYRVDLQRF